MERITVYREKDEKLYVDQREFSRYCSSIKSEEVESNYQRMNVLCKSAISECEEIVYSKKKFEVPKGIL